MKKYFIRFKYFFTVYQTVTEEDMAYGVPTEYKDGKRVYAHYDDSETFAIGLFDPDNFVDILKEIALQYLKKNYKCAEVYEIDILQINPI